MRLTVVTPTLNAGEFLHPCLESVQSQAGDAEIEHLLVDGGSTDETLAIARHYRATLLEGTDQGLYDAMNKGLAVATGQYVCFLGADDMLLPGSAQEVVISACATGANWLVGGLKWIDRKGRDLGTVGPPPRWMSRTAFVCLGWNCIHHQSTFMSRALLLRLGGFDLSYAISGDYELHTRALAEASFEPIRRPLAAFRRHGRNLSMSRTKQMIAENSRLLQTYAPRSRIARIFYRLLLRTWLNASNPSWTFYKLRGRILRGFDESRGLS